MSKLVPFSFENHQLRIIADDGGNPVFVVKDVMVALEYADTSNISKSIAHVPDEWKGREPIPTPGGVQEMAVFTEQGFYFFLGRSDKPKALPLQKLVAGEILPSIRKTGGYQIGQKPAKRERVNSQLAAKMVLARAAKSWLKMSDTSTIRMLSQIAESEGIRADFLPAYVNETLTKAITPMLKDMGHELGSHVAHIVHPALEAMGILEHLSRKSGSDRSKIKRFWSLTEEGLKYGRNETNPNNPRETQPLYFVDKFPELLARLEAHLAAHPPGKPNGFDGNRPGVQ